MRAALALLAFSVLGAHTAQAALTQVRVIEGAQAGANAGAAVSCAGDVNFDGYSDLLVGVPNYDGTLPDEGAVFLYLGSPSGLASTPAWSVFGGQTAAHLGAALTYAGDVNGDGYGDVVIAAPDYDNGQTDEGRGYLYLGRPAGLDTAPAWTRESDIFGAHFGASVSSAGDVNGDGLAEVYVGVPQFANGQSGEGSSALFGGTITGLTEAPIWTTESNQIDANEGTSVANAGDINADGFDDLIVGTPFGDVPLVDQGRVSVYLGHILGPSDTPEWALSVPQMGAHGGAAVAGAGDVNGDGYCDILIAATAYDNGQADEGRVWLYPGTATGPSNTATWSVEGNLAGAAWGTRLSTAGDVNGDGYADVIVGSSAYGAGGLGRASVYLGSATGLATSPSFTLNGAVAGDAVGSSVACAGDFNGDGYNDIVIGAAGREMDETDEGLVYVLAGGPDLPQTAPSWTMEGEQEGAGFGFRVAGAGDVNGDGYGDVIVSAHTYSNGQAAEGRALAYLGSRNGLGTTAAWTTEANQDSAEWGGSVAPAWDVNGDGYADVLVGVPQWDGALGANEGRVSLYLGAATGLGTTAAWTITGAHAGAGLGTSVASAGDVNGDGYADVIVGAPQTDAIAHPRAGRADVYLGSALGLGAAPAWTRYGTQDSAGFGFRVASAGDVNADGFSDVIVSAWLADDALVDQGAAYVYLGSAAGLDTMPVWTAFGEVAGSLFGSSVAPAGDLNGDGRSDVLVGANRYGTGAARNGRAYVFLGAGDGVETSPAWTATGVGAASLGTSCASLDANNDGFSDVLVGAPSFSNGQVEEGVVRLFLGSAAGVDTLPAWSYEGNRVGAHAGQGLAPAGDVNGDAIPDIVIGAGDVSDPLAQEGAAYVLLSNGGDGIDRLPRQMRTETSKLIVALGLSDHATEYRVRASARSPFGRTQLAMEYEAAPFGTPLDGTHSIVGPFVDTGPPDPGSGSAATLDVFVSNVVAGSLSHWRARFVTESPLMTRMPWFTLVTNALTEADVRLPATSAVVPPPEHAVAPVAPPAFSATPAVSAGQVQFDVANVPLGAPLQLRAYNVHGALVRTFVPERTDDPARYSARWDGRDARGRPVSSGVYLVRVTVGETVVTRRVVVRR